MIDKALKQPVMTVRTLAKIIGTLVACFPAVEYGQLFYRELEFIKIEALKVKYDYEQNIALTDQSKEELKWWTTEGINCGRHISHGNADEIIVTDASGHGWGAVYKGKHTQGLWTHSEAKKHINVLEMRAGLIGIQSLCNDLKNCHLQIQMDNQTSVTYINNLGGTHSKLVNQYARELILWCKNRDIWLSACHIAG